MDIIELESVATQFYQRFRLPPDEPVSTYKLARLRYGRGTITRPPTLLGRFPSCAYLLQGIQHIAVRRSVPDDEAQWYLGHELAHLELGKPHGAGAEVEANCDYLAACLMAPRSAVLALHRAFGWDLRGIAREVVATQTWAGLRLAEALLVPLAAVGPSVRVRGPEEWVWPDEPTIRGWARGRSCPVGVKKIRVTDRPKRALLAAL